MITPNDIRGLVKYATLKPYKVPPPSLAQFANQETQQQTQSIDNQTLQNIESNNIMQSQSQSQQQTQQPPLTTTLPMTQQNYIQTTQPISYSMEHNIHSHHTTTTHPYAQQPPPPPSMQQPPIMSSHLQPPLPIPPGPPQTQPHQAIPPPPQFNNGGMPAELPPPLPRVTDPRKNKNKNKNKNTNNKNNDDIEMIDLSNDNNKNNNSNNNKTEQTQQQQPQLAPNHLRLMEQVRNMTLEQINDLPIVLQEQILRIRQQMGIPF